MIAADDRIVLVGGSAEQATQIATTFGLRNVRHHDPPMGFIQDAKALDDCLEFIEQASPFRFCFLAVGSPQQELVATSSSSAGSPAGWRSASVARSIS